MHPGDFIITPSWTWHDHGNLGIDGVSEPVVWLDGLDIPMVRYFDAGFAENDSRRQPGRSRRAEGSSFARFGYNMAPVKDDPPRRHLADLQLSVRPLARGTATLLARTDAARRLARHQAALHQPADRRLADADHGHLHAAAAERLRGPAAAQHRRRRLQRGRRPRHSVTSAGRHSPSPRATPSWCRRGPPLALCGPRRDGAVQLFRPPGAGSASACCASRTKISMPTR